MKFTKNTKSLPKIPKFDFNDGKLMPVQPLTLEKPSNKTPKNIALNNYL